jgi:ATP-dependent RNA/DNA helicase IGHMBP2
MVASTEDLDSDLLEGWAAGGPGSGHLRLDMLSNESTHEKMLQAVEDVCNYPADGPAARIIDMCFSGRACLGTLPPVPKTAPTQLPPDGPSYSGAVLNDAQRAAVTLGMSTEDVALIHGPPGTGKTTAVVELILQAVRRQRRRVLVCAPSNVAVDNIAERLALAPPPPLPPSSSTDPTPSRTELSKRPVRIVRLGHPARLAPATQAYSLEALVEAADGTAIVRDIRAELAALERRGVSPKTPQLREARRQWRGETRALRRELRTREARVVGEVVSTREVVLCTCVGAGARVLREERFDLVVIDEAAQALEAANWIPIQRGGRVVLAGDHKQLAPTVKSGRAEALALGVTLFDRLMREDGVGGPAGGRACMLQVQYRMHADICAWASRAMYEGRLRADPSVARRTLAGLGKGEREDGEEGGDEDMTEAVLLFLDTAGCGMEEEEGERPPSPPPSSPSSSPSRQRAPKKTVRVRSLLSSSRANEGEAQVVAAHVQALLRRTGLAPADVAVITPYNAQVERLRSLLHPQYPDLQVRSVDGFQGGEREAVVLSLVRSNHRGEVGFLRDDRRLNVAVTRAKRHCCLVGDSETVGRHPFLASLLQHCDEVGQIRSAMEYLPEWGVSGGGGGRGAEEGRESREVVGAKRTSRMDAPVSKMREGMPTGQEGRQGRGRGSGGGVGRLGGETVGRGKAGSTGHGGGQDAERGSKEGRGGEGDEAFAPSSPPPTTRPASPVPDNLLVAQTLGFCLDPALPRRLALPLDLSGRQRKLVHDLVEGLKLSPPVSHLSRGKGKSRQLVLDRLIPLSRPTSLPPCPSTSPEGMVAAEDAAFALEKETRCGGRGKRDGREGEGREGERREGRGEEGGSGQGEGGEGVSGQAGEEEEKEKEEAGPKQAEHRKRGGKKRDSLLALKAEPEPGGQLRHRLRSEGSGRRIEDGAEGRPMRGNLGLGALHAARLKRQEERGDREGNGNVCSENGMASEGAERLEGRREEEGRTEQDAEGNDEMAALEEAIRANANLQAWPRPPSEATRERLYGWNRNPAQKDLRENLRKKLIASEEKRRPEGGGKKEGKKGGQGRGSGRR